MEAAQAKLLMATPIRDTRVAPARIHTPPAIRGGSSTWVQPRPSERFRSGHIIYHREYAIMTNMSIIVGKVRAKPAIHARMVEHARHYCAQVWNRADCCASRLNGVKVYVGSHLCGALTSTTSVQTITCNKSGSYVKLVEPRSDYLSLCEVKVYAQ